MAVEPSQNTIGAAFPYCPKATLPLVSFHGDSDSQLNRKELRHQNHIKPQLEHPPIAQHCWWQVWAQQADCRGALVILTIPTHQSIMILSTF